MKINSSQTRSLDRVIDNQLGTGTSILSEGAAVILLPGAKDQIQLSQLGNRLQILVNGSEKFLLTERESQNFHIRGDQKNTTIDPSVSIYSSKKSVILSGEPAPFPGISAERGEQLGHARRVESSFETAVTRKVITKDLKEDVFINHIGKQMQRLLTEMGGTTQQQISFRSEKDLLPLLTQLENVSGNAKAGGTVFSRNFLQDLNTTVKKVRQGINNGGSVELEFLGSQITRGLKQVINSKTAPFIDMQAGKIPFEAHEIPVGESQRDAFQRLGIINEAINKSDVELIRDMASDASFLKVALPTEKAAFVNALSKQINSTETAAAEKILNRQNIIQILQSGQDTQEFRNILNMAGVQNVQDAFKDNSAEFNMTAHVFGTGEFAVDPNQPLFTGNPFVQGFSPQQIFAARQQMFLNPEVALSGDLSWSAEDAVRFSKNPLLLAIASPDQKALLIRGLQEGYVSMDENRSIINILQSAMNKTEFDRIVDFAGGKSIGLALQDPVSVLQWNRLAGAYDRMDLTTDFVEGVKYSGALLEPFPFDENELGSLTQLKATLIHDHMDGDIAGILGKFMKDAGDWIGNQIGALERGVYVQAGLENLNRMMEEMPLINIPLIRNQLYAILQQSNMNPQHILNHLLSLPTSSGLTEHEIRNLISQPLAFAYQTAASEAGILAQNVIEFLQKNLQLNVFQFGPQSPQALLVQTQIERVQKTFLPFAERLQSISNVLAEAFPPPADFIGSLSEFTSGFTKNFGPLLSDVFPELSPAFLRISENAQSIESLVKGKSVDGMSNTPVLPGMPTTSQLLVQLSSMMKGIDMIATGDLVGQFSNLGQKLLQVPDIPRDILQFTKQATSFLSSVQDGSYAKTLIEIVANLKKHDDPIADLAKTTAQNGAIFLTQLQNGTFSKISKEFVQEIQNFQNNPGVSRMNNFFERLTVLTNGILGETSSDNITDQAGELISEIASNGLRGSFGNIAKAAARLRELPVFTNLIELLERGGSFLNALRDGNFAQSMELMNSRFGYSPAIAQIIERGLHLTTTGSNVMKVLINRDFERPVAQLTRKAQSKTESAKELAAVETIFSSASTFFYAVSDIQNMDLMWHYHRQLGLVKEEATIDSAIRHFEKQTQLLAAEPKFKEALQQQVGSFQDVRNKSSKK